MRIFKAGKSLIGVDITSDAVKLLELKNSRETYQVQSYAMRPLADGAVAEGRIHDADDVTRALMQALDDAQPATRKAAIALPARMAITKTLTFPAELSEEEIEERLMVESDQYLSFPFTEVAFDFVAQGLSPSAPHLQQVLLVACRHQELWQWTDVVARAGLEPAAVDVETFALERAFTALSPPHKQAGSLACTGLVGLTGRRGGVVFNVFHGEQIVYTHEVADAIRNDIHLTTSTPCFKTLAQQVNRALRLYYATEKAHDVRHLVLAGDAATTPGLAAHIAQVCRIDVALADPLHAMTLTRRLADTVDSHALAADSSRLLTACGLAMRVAL